MKIYFKYAAVIFAMCSSLLTASALSPADNAEPVTIVSHVDIKPDAYLPQAEEKSRMLFRAETASTRHDAGLVSYEIFQEVSAPNHFTIVETWRDNRAYDMHVGSDHTVKFREQIQPFLGSPFDSRIHHQFR